MITQLLCLLLCADTVPPAPHDSIRTDTLREVIIEGRRGQLPVMDAINKSLGKSPQTRTFGDVLERVAPGLQDKMLHPFAIKQRKKERRIKRARKILDHYDQVKTFDELLNEAVQRQQMEDERKAKWQAN